MQKIKQFLTKNKVLLTGIASALLLVLQQYTGVTPVDFRALGVACLLAVAGVIGNYLKGQYLSMAGIIGIAFMALKELLTSGHVNWDQFIISLAVAALTLAVPAPQLLDKDKK